MEHGKAATVSTSYNLTSGSRYYATNALGMLDQEGEFYFVSHVYRTTVLLSHYYYYTVSRQTVLSTAQTETATFC